jgi:hypothetical protein
MVDTPARQATYTRVESLLFLITGVGVVATTPFVLWHLARRGELPITPFGFRLLAGPFERLGTTPFVGLTLALAVVSILDVVAGLWLWRGRRGGARLGLATSPVVFALGVGFAVPILLVTVPIRVALILSRRRRLGEP